MLKSKVLLALIALLSTTCALAGAEEGTGTPQTTAMLEWLTAWWPW